MASVTINERAAFERALRTFNQQVADEGILRDSRAHAAYLRPSVRRHKRQQAHKLAARRQQRHHRARRPGRT